MVRATLISIFISTVDHSQWATCKEMLFSLNQKLPKIHSHRQPVNSAITSQHVCSLASYSWLNVLHLMLPTELICLKKLKPNWHHKELFSASLSLSSTKTHWVSLSNWTSGAPGEILLRSVAGGCTPSIKILPSLEGRIQTHTHTHRSFCSFIVTGPVVLM